MVGSALDSDQALDPVYTFWFQKLVTNKTKTLIEISTITLPDMNL